MSNDELLIILKCNVNIISTDPNTEDFLKHCLQSARQMIQREGIELEDTVEDGNLIIMYAAYLYRKRATNEPMPRMLRWAMNNRLFSQKAKVSDAE